MKRTGSTAVSRLGTMRRLRRSFARQLAGKRPKPAPTRREFHMPVIERCKFCGEIHHPLRQQFSLFALDLAPMERVRAAESALLHVAELLRRAVSGQTIWDRHIPMLRTLLDIYQDEYATALVRAEELS